MRLSHRVLIHFLINPAIALGVQTISLNDYGNTPDAQVNGLERIGGKA